MGWGYIREHTICNELTYARCKAYVDKAKVDKYGDQYHYISAGKSRNYYLHATGHSHPVTGGHVPCYAYRMYNTDILQYFEDGAIRIVTYNSPITYSEINRFGPVTCYNDSQSKFRESRRFRPTHGGPDYPISDGTLDIDKDGFVVGPVIDRHTIIDPAKQAERRAIAKRFREMATPRVLLGEFGDIWAEQIVQSVSHGFGRWSDKGTWFARVPRAGYRKRFAELLLEGSTHPDMDRVGEVMVRGQPAKDKHDAALVAIRQMQKALLSGEEWEKEVATDYGRVNVRGEE